MRSYPKRQMARGFREYASHPYYLYCKNMIRRSREGGVVCDFLLTSYCFSEWLKVIGIIPEGMIRPSIGRYDHSKGYEFDLENSRWNFRWQEYSVNAKEVSLRGNSTFQRATSEQQTEWSRKAVESSKHISKQLLTCYWCGYNGKAPNILRFHFDNCKRRYMHLIQDMKPVEYPQMMLSFGS